MTFDPPAAGSSSTAILCTPIRPLKSRQQGATIGRRPISEKIVAEIILAVEYFLEFFGRVYSLGY